MSSTAYLVGWRDVRTGAFIDAGIYSEPSPTIPIASPLRPVALSAMQSRFAPGHGGFERAVLAMEQLADRTPSLAWVTRTRTYRIMRQNRTRMAYGTRLVARTVVPSAHAQVR